MYPVLFSLGPINIYSFGVFLALAFLVGAFFVWRESRNELDEELLLDAIVMVTILAFLGARFFYIFSHFPNFNFNPLRWIHFYLYPGFSFWGGVIGGLLGMVWFARWKKASFWRLADFLVIGVALGQILGQMGCFLNGCTVGKVTTLPWGQAVVGFLEKRHPVAAYDALAALVIFLAVFRVHRWIFAQKRKREGSSILAYLTLLTLFSLPLEFLKEGGVYLFLLSLNQWVALFFFVSASSLWYLRMRNLRQDLFLILTFLKERGRKMSQERNLEGGKSDQIPDASS